MTAHYKNFDSIKTVNDLRSIFPDGEANENNWCVFSTSGVHGTYTTIKDLDLYFDNPDKFNKEEDGDEEYKPNLTVLVIRPRIVSMLYGHIEVKKEDLPYLRKLAYSTIKAIDTSQKGNL